MRICLAVPTFKREAYLPELFDAIGKLAIPYNCLIEVLIADNDPAASARDIVAVAQSSVPFDVEYLHVPVAGLSSVRNVVLAHAKASADVLAMLDDDELPEPQWLEQLVRVLRESGADAVVGPVLALFKGDVPTWLREFREREYPKFDDGSKLHDGWTSNCLVQLSRVVSMDLAFDPSLNFIGGEDQLFFRQMITRGGVIAYAARAIVWEHLPAARRSVQFVLKRSFRRGNSVAICDGRLDSSPLRFIIRAGKGVALMTFGLVRLVPMALLHGKAAAIETSFEIARGAGMLAGLLKMSYQPYRRGA